MLPKNVANQIWPEVRLHCLLFSVGVWQEIIRSRQVAKPAASKMFVFPISRKWQVEMSLKRNHCAVKHFYFLRNQHCGKSCGTAESIILSDSIKSVRIINIDSTVASIARFKDNSCVPRWTQDPSKPKEKQLAVQQNGCTIMNSPDGLTPSSKKALLMKSGLISGVNSTVNPFISATLRR